ncbi:MAG: hypothetical protein LBH09_00860, partial [Peptococcaceae bacterium]|nr:hypothetical protein [Peptococcaceae bacterium]
QEVLSDVFLPLYDETEAKYAALEKRVREELPLVYDAFKIYSTVMPRNRADSILGYLSPVIPLEAAEPMLEAKGLSEANQPVIETVFCEADYLKCRQIIRDEMILEGAFVIGADKYPFRCRLQASRRYLKAVEDLRDVFLRNAMPWTTVNSAYLNKFFDVRLIELSRKLPTGTLIYPSQIQIDFGLYEDIAKRGMIPLWNIDMHSVIAEDYPLPASNSVNYEYRLDVGQLGTECGYLADREGITILNTRREGTELVVVSPMRCELDWALYRFRPRRDQAIGHFSYPIISNAREDSFSARLFGKYGAHITTLAEMSKLVNAFEASEFIQLASVRFADQDVAGETYDMNPFFQDEVRDPAYQKTLVFGFSAKSRGHFLNRDIGSFLVTEMQSAYPEFHCVGIVS